MDLKSEIYSPKWDVFPKNWKNILAANIKSERARLGISQKELATKMGASDGGTISYWENAKGFFNIETLVMLSEYLGRSPNELLTQDLSGSSPPEGTRQEGIGAHGGGGAESPAAAESPPIGLHLEMKALEKTVFDAVLKMRELQEAVEHRGSNFDKSES